MSLRDLAADPLPLDDICTDEECVGCGRHSSHSQEAEATLTLIALAPQLAVLCADLADALQTSKSFDDEDAKLIARYQEIEART